MRPWLKLISDKREVERRRKICLHGYARWLAVNLLIVSWILDVRAEVRVEGKLKLFAFPADTNSPPFRTADFVLTRSECKWNILLTNFVYREPEGPLAIQYFTDCKDVYHVTFWTKKSVEDEKIRETKKDPSMAERYKDLKTEAVNVISGRFPKNREPIEIAPWIGFCLPFETEQGKTNSIPNVFSTLAWPTNRLAYKCDFSPDSSYPARVTLWKPGIGMRQTPKHTFEQMPLAKPYDVGYKGLVFEVISWSEDKRNPSSFIQTTYNVPLQTLRSSLGPSQPEPTVIVVGDISAITEEPESELGKQTVPDMAIVVDSRRNISAVPLAYESRRFGILDSGDLNLSNKIQKIRLEQSAQIYTHTPNPFGRWILCIVLAAPLFAMAFYRSKSRPKHNNEIKGTK